MVFVPLHMWTIYTFLTHLILQDTVQVIIMHFMIVLTALLGIVSFIYSTFVLIRGIRSIRRVGLWLDNINLICCAVFGYLVALYAGCSVWMIIFR